MIVMKFGGTSVQDAKAIERVAHIVQGRLADRPVVVVSAMAKVTDSLLAMGKAAGGGDRKTALKMARALRERHYDTAGELLGTALFTAISVPTSKILTNCCAALAPSVK
jgi:aspartate kinase